MVIYDGLGYRQSQPGTVGATGNHGHENRVLDVFRDPGSVIDDVHLADQPVPLSADGELPSGAGTQGNRATARVGSGLQRVAHDVENDLRQLTAVAGKFRQAGVVIADHHQPAARFGDDQVAYMLQDLMDIELL